MYGRIFRLSIRFDTQFDSILVTIRLTIRFDDLDSMSDDLEQVFYDLH